MPEPNSTKPTKSSGWLRFCAVVRQVPVDHAQPGEADRDVDEKNHAPMKISDDQSAGDGPSIGPIRPGNRDETHGADELGLREGRAPS